MEVKAIERALESLEDLHAKVCRWRVEVGEDEGITQHADWSAIRNTPQTDAFLVALFALRHIKASS